MLISVHFLFYLMIVRLFNKMAVLFYKLRYNDAQNQFERRGISLRSFLSEVVSN